MEQKDNRQSIITGIGDYIRAALKGKMDIEVLEAKDEAPSLLSEKLKKDQWILFSTGVHPIGYVGVNSNWVSILSRAVLNMDKNATGEVADDLVKEFAWKMVHSQLPEPVKDDGASKDSLAVANPVQMEKNLMNTPFSILDFQISVSFSEEDEQNIDAPLFLILFPSKEHKNGSLLSRNGRNGIHKDNHNSDNGKKVEFEEFRKELSVANDFEVRNIEILKDVQMNLSVELGRKEIPLGEILKLVKGSVIELDKMAGEPVEILVNGYRIAHGEVVVIDEHFGVRVTNLVSERERMRSLI